MEVLPSPAPSSPFESPAPSGQRTAGPQPTLRRDLGAVGAASLVVGIMIGTGILLVPRSMTLNAGSPVLVLGVWVAGGLLTLAGVLTYAELAAAIPETGGEYNYLRLAYGPLAGFLYGWTQIWIAKCGSLAALAAGLTYYLAEFLPHLDKPLLEYPIPIRSGQLVAMALILAVGGLNYFGIRLGGRVQLGVTALKIALLAVIIAVGLGAGAGHLPANLATSVPRSGTLAAGLFQALVAALWSYDGWNNVTLVAAETRRAERNLPLALVGGTVLVIVTYLLINLAYFAVLTAPEVASTARPAAGLMERVWGAAGARLVSCAAIVSIFAALNGATLACARIPFAMARDGLFFQPLGQVATRYGTPGKALLFMSALGAIVVLTGTFEQLASYVMFASWAIYGLAGSTVFVLRRRLPDLARPYRVPFYPVLPAVFVASAAAVVLATLVNAPRQSAVGAGLILLGVPFHFYWRRGVPPVADAARSREEV